MNEGASPKDVAVKIKKGVRSLRGLKEGDEDFSVQTTDDLMDSFSTILSVVQAVVLGLAFDPPDCRGNRHYEHNVHCNH